MHAARLPRFRFGVRRRLMAHFRKRVRHGRLETWLRKRVDGQRHRGPGEGCVGDGPWW